LTPCQSHLVLFESIRKALGTPFTDSIISEAQCAEFLWNEKEGEREAGFIFPSIHAEIGFSGG
jgi:hypothetical protein